MFVAFCTAGNKWNEGLEFFGGLTCIVDQSSFSSINAYAVYFAYHCKDYSHIKHILNSFTSLVNIDSFNTNNDHSMLHFYKGLIYLRQSEFEKTFSSFSVCVRSAIILRGEIISLLQLDAIKFIILLSLMPSLEKYLNFNHFIYSQLKRYVNLKELECYSILFSSKGLNLVEWIQKNKIKLKQGKTLVSLLIMTNRDWPD